MNDTEAPKNRYEQILGEDNTEVSDKTLELYRTYIHEHIVKPCDLTGREDFKWEEFYLFDLGDQNEYEALKKTQPSYLDSFTFISFDEQIEGVDGLMVKVKRISDRKQFVLPLVDLKVIDNNSPNYPLIHDYAVWYLNY